MKKIIFLFTCFIALNAAAQNIHKASFENYSLPTDSFDNGSKGTTLIEDDGFRIPVVWDTAWGGYWADGWALSNQTDSTREGTDGLYQSITGGAADGNNYLVGQNGSEINWLHPGHPAMLEVVQVTNSSYAYHSMLNGDAFAKKFGGVDGNDPDYLILNITGKLDGIWIQDTIQFYLADYRFADNSKDYIIKDWQEINLNEVSYSDTLRFFLTSSDTGQFGINTPTFFCLDNFNWSFSLGTKKVAKPSIKLYPNPAQNILIAEGVKEWTIYTIQGKALLSGASENIDIRNLLPGTYLLRDAEGRSSRFIKQ